LHFAEVWSIPAKMTSCVVQKQNQIFEFSLTSCEHTLQYPHDDFNFPLQCNRRKETLCFSLQLNSHSIMLILSQIYSLYGSNIADSCIERVLGCKNLKI